jgi:hypothetical protein
VAHRQAGRRGVLLGAGAYRKFDLIKAGVGPNTLSSLQLPVGMKISLFQVSVMDRSGITDQGGITDRGGITDQGRGRADTGTQDMRRTGLVEWGSSVSRGSS